MYNDNKYIDAVINAYARDKVESPAKEEFHEWLTNGESADEKERALFDLWNQINET
ncbi:MAG: hypothetical protein LBR34_07875 [Prevotella sp.]|jgi:hypothetical protein|nr:hypothetical protein [Prevotella sp.]